MNKDFFESFHIGAYYLQKYARSEKHVKELKECGVDFVIGMDNDREILDLFDKYGVKAVVSGIVPSWFGGKGENSGTMKDVNKKEDYIKGRENFTDHSAIVGIDIGDEPSSLDFPYYGEMARLTSELFENKFPYMNVYPSYGMLGDNSPEQIKKELGTDTYKEYLKAYCENIALPYLSYDHYVYSSDKARFISDLAIASKLCEEYSKKLFIVLQVNSHKEGILLSENELRYQAFSALAFGVSAISWACYTGGWWYNNVLDENGEKTAQYEKLKKVNAEIKNITKVYENYKQLKTVIFETEESFKLDADEIKTEGKLLLGIFENRENEKAILFNFVNKGTIKIKSEKALIYCKDSSETLNSVNGEIIINSEAYPYGFVCL